VLNLAGRTSAEFCLRPDSVSIGSTGLDVAIYGRGSLLCGTVPTSVSAAGAGAVLQASWATGGSGDPTLDAAVEHILELGDDAEAIAALTQLTGASAHDGAESVATGAGMFAGVLTDRLGGLSPDACPAGECLGRFANAVGLVMSDASPTRLATANQWSLWADTIRTSTANKPADPSLGGEAERTSAIMGADRRFLDGVVAGAALELGSTEFVSRSGLVRSRAEGYQAGFYGSADWEGLLLAASLAAGWTDIESARTITFVPAVARADYGAWSVSSSASVSTTFIEDGFQFQPSIQLAYRQQWVDGFTETGAGGLNLIVAQSQSRSLQSRLGARLSYAIAASPAFNLTPWAGISVSHEFIGGANGATQNFSGLPAPNSDFIVQGSDRHADATELRLGVDAVIGSGFGVSAGYAHTMSAGARADSLNAGLVLKW
jgi:outer membrane autotransporter protein